MRSSVSLKNERIRFLKMRVGFMTMHGFIYLLLAAVYFDAAVESFIEHNYRWAVREIGATALYASMALSAQ